MIAPVASAVPALPGRNDPCHCGSGRRYKECCGRFQTLDARSAVRSVMEAALEAQRARNLKLAAEHYRRALALAPDEPDALHMLGVICYERDELAEAYALILRALDLTGWKILSYRHNLGLVLACFATQRDGLRSGPMRARYRAWLKAKTELPCQDALPKVAVVVPCYNHAPFVDRALASVFAQTYREVELVVIDDGSSDDSAAVARRVLKDSPFPTRFVSRPNRGAAATINEAVALSSAAYVNILNSDDTFAPERLQVMVERVAGRGFEWGFSAVEVIGADERPVDPLRERRALRTLVLQGSLPLAASTGFALVSANPTVSSGNLFFSRQLFERLGGFRDFRYNHDWDFCLRALRLAEPLYVAAPTYRYRIHSDNTITESPRRAKDEADGVLREYLEWAATTEPCASEWAPCVANWREEFVIRVLSEGMAEVLDLEKLRSMARLFGGPVTATPRAANGRGVSPVASGA